MRSIYIESFSQDILSGLRIGEHHPRFPGAAVDAREDDWVDVTMRAASLNHHDLWSLRGVGLREESLPMVLGTDGAGTTDDGRNVIIHSVITSPTWTGPETLDPARTLLSEKYPGTFSDRIRVPARNLLALPPELSFAEAACLPTAYLTAYNLLFGSADVKPGQRVLIQGATGGVSSAATMLARVAGAHVTVSTRNEANAAYAKDLGAHDVIGPGERIAPVDAVIETVGEATWQHSLRSLKPGGVVAVAGATSGPAPSADLNRLFFRNLRIVGTTMGSLAQLRQLVDLLVTTGLRPRIHQEYDFYDDAQVRQAFTDLDDGTVNGKAVLVRN